METDVPVSVVPHALPPDHRRVRQTSTSSRTSRTCPIWRLWTGCMTNSSSTCSGASGHRVFTLWPNASVRSYPLIFGPCIQVSRRLVECASSLNDASQRLRLESPFLRSLSRSLVGIAGRADDNATRVMYSRELMVRIASLGRMTG